MAHILVDTRIVELKKITSSWTASATYAKTIGKVRKESNSRVVDACASELYKL